MFISSASLHRCASEKFFFFRFRNHLLRKLTLKVIVIFRFKPLPDYVILFNFWLSNDVMFSLANIGLHGEAT